jgi:hypothetical protein
MFILPPVRRRRLLSVPDQPMEPLYLIRWSLRETKNDGSTDSARERHGLFRGGAFQAAHICRPSIQYSGVVLPPGPNSWPLNIPAACSVPARIARRFHEVSGEVFAPFRSAPWIAGRAFAKLRVLRWVTALLRGAPCHFPLFSHDVSPWNAGLSNAQNRVTRNRSPRR